MQKKNIIAIVLIAITFIAFSGRLVVAISDVQQVQKEKSLFLLQGQRLCDSKRQQSIQDITEGIGSAQQLGALVDMLKTSNGCNKFLSDLLLDENKEEVREETVEKQ